MPLIVSKINRSRLYRDLIKFAVVKGKWLIPSYEEPVDYMQELDLPYQ